MKVMRVVRKVARAIQNRLKLFVDELVLIQLDCLAVKEGRTMGGCMRAMDVRERDVRVRVLCWRTVPVRSVLPFLGFVIIVIVGRDPSAREADVDAGDQEDEEGEETLRDEDQADGFAVPGDVAGGHCE